MPVFELILVAIVLITAVLGYRRGAIRQVGSILGIVVGIVACRLWGAQAAQSIGSNIGAYAALFIVGWVTTTLLARLLRGFSHAILLGPVDGLVGAVLMVFKWLVVISLALNIWQALVPDSAFLHPEGEGNQQAMTALLRLTPWLMDMVNTTINHPGEALPTFMPS
ncbi:MAG: CvpA family protein [Bacteroidales bacterium]|nr:CvpA family protein [Bacteroidales bacterium]